MKDSAMKRVFWFVVIGVLMFSVAYGSFVWSLGQTIRFTRLLVLDSNVGVILGFFVQFSPTFFLYMASAYSSDKPDEQNQRLWWMAAFWGLSLFDGLTNVGARFDRASMGDLPVFGFENPEYAQVATYLMVGMGVALDFGIVFAEELLGHIISAFFDNLSALITLLGGRPPKWLAMASSIGRAVGGKQPQHQDQRRGNKPQQGKERQRNPGGDRGNRGGVLDGILNSGNQNRSRRDVPVNRGDRRGNVTIMNGDDNDNRH